jgi:hypothetical protein
MSVENIQYFHQKAMAFAEAAIIAKLDGDNISALQHNTNAFEMK